jgi:hypothetical protein
MHLYNCNFVSIIVLGELGYGEGADIPKTSRVPKKGTTHISITVSYTMTTVSIQSSVMLVLIARAYCLCSLLMSLLNTHL